MNKVVFLNAGHGGSDPGAVANGFKEKDLNLAITIACRDALLLNGVSVYMSRNYDKTLTSTEVIRRSNNSHADLAVDIHVNAGKGDGAEVYCYSGGGTSRQVAENIIEEIKNIGQNSRGVKTKVAEDGSDYYYFIRDTSMPAVIVECAFIDNKEDLEIINSKVKQQAMGIAIAKGILKTFGIDYEEPAEDNLQVAGVQALLRQAYAQGIVKTFVKPIDNRAGKLTNAAILEAKEFLGMDSRDTDLSLKFISDLEHQVNLKRIARESK